MQLKYVHPILLDYKDVFVRSNRIDGSYFATTYKFKYDVPFLANEPLVHYDNVSNSDTDRIYDYSTLNKAETVQEAYEILEDKVLFKTYKVSGMKVDQYNELMKLNATVAYKLKELKHQDDMLAALESL